MKKPIVFLLLFFIILSVAGCNTSGSGKTPAENGIVQNAPESVAAPAAVSQEEQENKAKDTPVEQSQALTIPELDLPGITPEDIPITLSPDRKSLFLMNRVESKAFPKVLKGETLDKVDIIKMDTASGNRTVIEQAVPFISSSKWNSDGSIVAFCGGRKLTVYDNRNNQLLLENEIVQDQVTHFGWSPDGRTIYTEHPNLVNGSIISLDRKTLLHKYETDEMLYYKGMLDEDRFIATKELVIDEMQLKFSETKTDNIKTVVLDKEKRVLHEFPAGRYRDSSGQSLLQVGEEHFGLHYFPDMQNPARTVMLTQEYVYDAKFIFGGNFIFVTKSEDIEENGFLLYVADRNGMEIAKIPVSGSAVCVSPDGKKGFSSGPGKETLLFDRLVSGAADAVLKPAEGENLREEESLYRYIRGAMDTYFKNEMVGEKDYAATDRYFTDTDNPDQWAHFDMIQILNNKNYDRDSEHYSLSVVLNNLVIKDDRASATIAGSCRNSSGSGMGMGHALELVKKDGKWAVTGFSTFPESKQAKEVRTKLDGWIKQLKNGRLFDGELKGKEIKTGQIQFWQLSEPHLASNVNNANYCKVYLKVMEDGKETVYKMVLDKRNYKTWEPIELSKERLCWLF